MNLLQFCFITFISSASAFLLVAPLMTSPAAYILTAAGTGGVVLLLERLVDRA